MHLLYIYIYIYINIHTYTRIYIYSFCLAFGQGVQHEIGQLTVSQPQQFLELGALSQQVRKRAPRLLARLLRARLLRRRLGLLALFVNRGAVNGEV